MIRQGIFWGAALLCLVTAVQADDLYRVTMKNKQDAAVLRSTGVDGLVRLSDGFLVLADSYAVSRLTLTGLLAKLIMPAVGRDELGLEIEHGNQVAERTAISDEQEGIRVVRIPKGPLRAGPSEPAVMMLADEHVAIEFLESRYTAEAMLARLGQLSIPLEDLISRVSRDSLEFCERMLATFNPRYPGMETNDQARDWLASKLTAYGVDSVSIDSFGVKCKYGTPPGYNVVGYKFGSRYPDHVIVVGAHRDAPEVLTGGQISPAADDNGSGTVAVLEIARVLSSVETDMTIAFALFDAEEQGLFGAKHYATAARRRGDSIVYMLNLDMIGDVNNTSAARIYHGQQTGCADLWIRLADSLLYLTCQKQGQRIADHFSFDQAGYEANFSQEYNFSTVYHTIDDDTLHISWDYLTIMTQASLAAVYAVNATAWPSPTLAFRFPYGLPINLSPTKSTSFAVSITSVSGGVRVTGSEKLCYSIEGGEWVAVPLVPVSPDIFRAIIPNIACGSRIRYYVKADEASAGTVADTDTANGHFAVAASSVQMVFADDFETDKGWISVGTDSKSNWERGIPSGCGFVNEALLDYDRSGQCYQTGNGWYQTSPTLVRDRIELTSPAIDLVGKEAIVRFAVWYTNHAPYYDHYNYYVNHADTFRVFVSNGASDWVEMLQIGPAWHADGGWYTYSFRVQDSVLPRADTRLKFYTEDQGAYSLVDAALDAFQVIAYDCIPQLSCCSGPAGNVNMIGTIDLADLSSLVSYLTGGGYALPCTDAANVNGFGIVDLSDLSALVSYLTGGGYVLPNCP